MDTERLNVLAERVAHLDAQGARHVNKAEELRARGSFSAAGVAMDCYHTGEVEKRRYLAELLELVRGLDDE